MKTCVTFALLAFATLATTASAAKVEARLSAREAYVGVPIRLQIDISDAGDFNQPTLPLIDGCEVRSAGAPSQSSQISIINGRRSERQSIALQYFVTPRREGSFTVPSMAIDIGGQKMMTRALRFVATKSETGDLLFAEISGGSDKVFVGQPIDLTLKLWIKPFRDAKHDLTLSEGDMWNMVSEQSSWGGFSARMKELAEQGQRPGGREVLRNDGQGNQRSYYLYEIEAKVYPKRPGKIDADDLQIVVNYPTSIGKSRSPFEGVFDDSPFGGGGMFGRSSPLSRMMGDDFFGSSFGNRLAVSSARPIVSDVAVDATEVIPVPSEGQPADYRGAVGRYRMVVQATPTNVDAGDPITLNIGIQGTGPMDLVQAPPLYELPSLTDDFKVSDESLAGFVKDDTKVFSTTIRPRREGINQIPPIRFSYFDPETQSYETAISGPISITVNRSETLAMDAIVGTARPRGGLNDDASAMFARPQPDFTNSDATDVLVSQTPSSPQQWWWIFVVAPPLAWIATWCGRHRESILAWIPTFRSAQSSCLAAIERSEDTASISVALIKYISRRSGIPCHTASSALGVLRSRGMCGIANDLESDLECWESETLGGDDSSSLRVNQQQAALLTNGLEAAFTSIDQSRVRLNKRKTQKVLQSGVPGRAMGMMLAVAIAFSAANSMASKSVDLSPTQRQTLLAEAAEGYKQATSMAETDSADAKELLEAAAGKYQLLVDSGVHNSELYSNLGNAYLQSGELGRAIASYESAIRLDPGNRQLIANLEYANSKVVGESAAKPASAATAGQSMGNRLRAVNQVIVEFLGSTFIVGVLSFASLIFWGLLIARTAGFRFPLWRYAGVPLIILLVSLASTFLTQTTSASPYNAVFVADSVSLHAGDGEQFDRLSSLDAAQGHRVEVLGRRGNWTHVRVSDGQVGWVENRDVQRFDLS